MSFENQRGKRFLGEEEKGSYNEMSRKIEPQSRERKGGAIIVSTNNLLLGGKIPGLQTIFLGSGEGEKGGGEWPQN